MFFYLLLLGFIQGITEFLPVSSSAHLTIFQEIFRVKLVDKVLFDVMLHLGTLISIVVAYKSEVRNLFKSFVSLVSDVCSGKLNIKKNKGQNLLVSLIVATLPLIAIVPFQNFFESKFNSLKFVALMLIMSGILLKGIDKFSAKNTEKDITPKFGLCVGLSQLFAVFPGLSRSGTTIATAVALGFEKLFAIKFSFLMSLFAVAGAGILKLGKVIRLSAVLNKAEMIAYVLAVFVSFVSGVFSIRLLEKIVKVKKFRYFSYYCFAIGFSILLVKHEYKSVISILLAMILGRTFAPSVSNCAKKAQGDVN